MKLIVLSLAQPLIASRRPITTKTRIFCPALRPRLCPMVGRQPDSARHSARAPPTAQGARVVDLLLIANGLSSYAKLQRLCWRRGCTKTQSRRAKMPRRSSVLAAVIVATAGFSVAAYADEAADGRALAEKVCSPCHVVSDKVGPSFSEIAKGGYASPQGLPRKGESQWTFQLTQSWKR